MPALIRNAYGHQVARGVAALDVAPPAATAAPRKVSPHSRKATMAVVDRPPVAAAKDARELPGAGDKSRLWGHVASLPCQLCGAHGVQVAHSNALSDGKGRGLKAAEWRVAALCPDCHTAIDSGKDLSKEERRALWLTAHHDTIAQLFALGLVRPICKKETP